MKRITVRIPTPLRRQLERLCNRQRRSVSNVVRESWRRYIAAEQLRQMRNELRPFAEAVGVLTDDDVFKSVS